LVKAPFAGVANKYHLRREITIDLLRDKDFQLRNSKSPKELSGFFNISVRYNRKPFDFFDLQTFFTLSRNRFNEKLTASQGTSLSNQISTRSFYL
jgi:hypothetical protein